MNRLFKWLTIVLALCLPWHGAITVFLPDSVRYWKEIVLILFLAGFCFDWIKNKRKLSLIPFYKWKSKELFFAGLFLIYGLILIVFSEDKTTALLAFRYLGLGFTVYLLFSIISHNFAGFKKEFFKNFSIPFIFSSILSIIFGVWIKFSNGAEIVRNFYSQTISSWVPGQTIPLWHETGDLVRMQGASSGPIEFSHILFVALFLIITSKLKNIHKLLFSLIFLFGIYQSYSRASALGAIILLIFTIFKNTKVSLKNKKKVILVTVLLIFFAGFWGTKNTNILSRAGTSAHFTRPIEATKFGIKNIFHNNLGKLGPAARIKNLQKNNNDKAMIAENVFVDIFAQMGIIGLILYILFFWFLFWQTKPKFLGFLLAALIIMNLATIFDMTPLSIVFFLIFFLNSEEII